MCLFKFLKHISDYKCIFSSFRVVLIFTVERVSSLNSGLISGVDVVSRLKRKLRTDSSLLDVEVLSVDTVGKIRS